MTKPIIIFVLLAIYIGYRFTDNFDPESIKGKNVVITGASSGIGEQLAYQYARLGANVVITARREQRLKEVIAKCKQEGTNHNLYDYMTLDLGKEGASQRLIEFAEKKLGGIDVLVLNHKMVSSRGRWLGTPQNFTHLSKTININFYGYVRAATYAIPALEKSRGSIIVLSSVTGKVPNPFMASYSASKHAIEGFFGSLREEFIMGSKEISITICTFGFIETENAMKGVKAFGAERLLNSVKAEGASDTALAVIQAGASRAQRLYYPYGGARLVTALYCFFPETICAFFRYILETTQ